MSQYVITSTQDIDELITECINLRFQLMDEQHKKQWPGIQRSFYTHCQYIGAMIVWQAIEGKAQSL